MGRESPKREADGNGIHSPDMPTLCSNNCGFFGSAVNHNLCSKCYRDLFLQESKIDDVAEASTDQIDGGDRAETDSAAKEAAPTNRCGSCRKRFGLMGFKCRCGQTFCSLHRYSDKHGCPFDYKGAGQDAIAKANPVVKADKIEKI